MEGWQVFFEIPGKPPVELPDGESIIGRSRNSTVHIPETTVSRQHARVEVVGAGRVVVSDLGSSNGTYVNGEKVEDERRLADGDRVMVGDAELVIRILAPLEPADATVRVHVPALVAPPAAGAAGLDAPSAPPPVPAAALPAAPAATAAAPFPDRPLDAPLRPEPPAPPAPPRPMATPPPPRPAAPAAPPAAAPMPPAAPGKQEMLGSIAELDKMPLPPAKKGAVAPAPSKAPAAATGALGPAGFWIRVVAAMIDGAIAGVVMAVIGALGFGAMFFLPPELAIVSSGLIFLAGLGFGFLFGLYYPAKKGATPGKRLLKLAIVSDETSAGQGLGWSKAFVRLLGHLVCQFTFSLGYVMVAFTSRKQGLHDLIAKTYVVRLTR